MKSERNLHKINKIKVLLILDESGDKVEHELTFAACSVKAFDRNLGFYIEGRMIVRRLSLVSTR